MTNYLRSLIVPFLALALFSLYTAQGCAIEPCPPVPSESTTSKEQPIVLPAEEPPPEPAPQPEPTPPEERTSPEPTPTDGGPETLPEITAESAPEKE